MIKKISHLYQELIETVIYERIVKNRLKNSLNIFLLTNNDLYESKKKKKFQYSF